MASLVVCETQWLKPMQTASDLGHGLHFSIVRITGILHVGGLDQLCQNIA